MMDGAMSGEMTGWGMGLTGLILLVLVILGIAVLVKYFFAGDDS